MLNRIKELSYNTELHAVAVPDVEPQNSSRIGVYGTVDFDAILR